MSVCAQVNTYATLNHVCNDSRHFSDGRGLSPHRYQERARSPKVSIRRCKALKREIQKTTAH